jgi:ADP-ribosyl-[dinitrogen reductase] hydrolase
LRFHSDPRAEEGAHLVAAITRLIVNTEAGFVASDAIRELSTSIVKDTEFRRNIMFAIEAGERAITPKSFAEELGLDHGVSGFIVLTVPAAIYCWFANQGRFRDSIEAAVCLGGDSDTVGAIVGALAGTQFGSDQIPVEWTAQLAEWPCSLAWIDDLARAIADSAGGNCAQPIPEVSSAALLLRNLIFLVIVLSHGFRRLLPPY